MPLLLLVLLAADENPVTLKARALGQSAVAQGARLEATASLIRLHELLGDVDDLNLLAEPYGSLLGHRINAEVRQLARIFFAEVEQARGRTNRAQEALEPLGYVSDFYVV